MSSRLLANINPCHGNTMFLHSTNSLNIHLFTLSYAAILLLMYHHHHHHHYHHHRRRRYRHSHSKY